MTHHLTYRPQPAQIPADPHRGDPCDSRDTRRFPCNPRRHVSPAHPILNSSFLILNWSYTFSAKEKDSETGLSYFGSQYYSSDLSVWLSVDPMSGKYPSLSPYVYCADNPVRVVDPNGEDVWIPDGEGNVVAQEKDDYRSLAVTIDCSYHKAKKMLAAQGYENGVKEGDKVKLDNPYTRSINAHYEQRLTDEQAEAYYQKCRNAGMSDEDIKTRLTELACPQDLYNCWSAAMAGSTNQEIGPATYDIFDETTFDDKLSKCKWPVSVDRLKFGKTIIRFEKNGVCTHAAVYYGTDKSGNIYIYTKNGKYTRPFVIPLNEFIERYGDLYGKVSGYYN